jgi:ubiquinone biosynthesis monooxygenase Coq7
MSKVTAEERLPGDLTKDQLIDQIVRVNHAGEYGAKRIYEGQLAALKGSASEEVIRKMKLQEEVHLKYFEQLIPKRKVRPTLLFPFWHIAGFALGYISGKISEKTAMATTEAIEEVIDEHYKEQLDLLGDDEKELKSKIEQFRQEEVEHKEIAASNQANQAPAYDLFTSAIKLGCKFSIWLAKKI